MKGTTDAVVIGNPNSGRAGDRGFLERHAEVLRSGGIPARVLNTEYPNHATELAAGAGDRLVVAAGGEGTANVLARELGLPLDAGEACRRIVAGSPTRIDLGVARDEDGAERCFACMAGVGFDAKVVGEVTPRQKRYLRRLAFQVVAFKVLFRDRFPQVRITAGKDVRTARFAIVANGHYYGGDYRVTGPGLLTSGKLETVLVERVGSLLRPDVFWGIIFRRPLNRAMESFEATEVRAESSGTRVPVQIDGELWGELPMAFRVEPGALQVVC
jgi:diacylglycerol kinase family enzyme